MSQKLSQEFVTKTGIINLTKDEIERGLYVTDISKEETLKTVSDFFSFCGNIEKIIMDNDPNSEEEKKAAVVIFQTGDQYETGLLVSFSTITDKTSPIKVQPLGEVIDFIPSSQPKPQQQIQKTNNQQPSSSNTKPKEKSWWENVFGDEGDEENPTAFISSFISTGFQTGNKFASDLKKQAKEIDENFQISNKTREGAKAFGTTAKGVTNKTLETARYVTEKTLNTSKEFTRKSISTANSLAKQMELKEKADSAAKKTFETASLIKNKAMEFEPIKVTVTKTNSLAETIKNKAMENENIKEGVAFSKDVVNYGMGSVKSAMKSWFGGWFTEPEPEQQQQQPQQEQSKNEEEEEYEKMEEEEEEIKQEENTNQNDLLGVIPPDPIQDQNEGDLLDLEKE